MKSTKLHRQQSLRRDRLLTYLRELAVNEPEVFDLSDWLLGENQSVAVKTWRRRYVRGERLNCGTTACVYGHFPVVFPQHFYWKSYGLGGEHYVENVFSPRFYYTDAIAFYLGGNPDDWSKIIYPEYYPPVPPTLPNVIARIDSLHQRLEQLHFNT